MERDHLAGRVPHEEPHLQRRVVVAVLLTIQVSHDKVVVVHPLHIVGGGETVHNALLALIGVESDGNDDGFGGHIFAGFDAAKIGCEYANAWHNWGIGRDVVHRVSTNARPLGVRGKMMRKD